MKFIPLAAAALATSFALASDPAPRPVDYLVAGFEDATKDATVIDGELWTGDSDSAIVREYAEAPSLQSYPAPFENAGSQFLEIDASSEVKVNPGAQGGITYIDSMVKFSAAEEDPSASITDAMFLLWLQKNGSSYDIKVKGALADLGENDSFSLPAKTYTISGSGVTIEPDSWHRVKVAFFPQLFGEDGDAFAAFTIQIDGLDMAATEATCTQSVYDGYISGSIDDEYAALFAANKMIPASNPAATITSIGFQGNGAIDDLVVSADAPLPTSVVLDWTISEFSNVAYVIGDVTNSLDVTAGTATINCPKGSAITLLGTTTAGCTVAATGDTTTPPALTTADISWYFPQTATAGQDGTAEHPFEIADAGDLKALQAAVANVAAARSLCYVQVADIALDIAWPGIGIQNGKDIVATAEFDNGAFTGTYDGGNYTISNFQMVGRDGNPANAGKDESAWEGLDYCGFFNSTCGATIKNLKIQYAGGLFAADTTATTKESGATFVGVAKNSTLRNLTSLQKDDSTAVSASKGFGGISGYTTSGTVIDSCTNNVNMTSLAGNKCGGIAMITQNGEAVTITNCQNTGTQTTGSTNSEYGAIVGYVGLNTTIADCETTVGRFLKHQNNTVTLQGVNKGDATVLAYHGAGTPGLNFATVDNGVATFVADDALALNGSYKVMSGNATATFVFTDLGTISFDEALSTPTYAITSSGAAGNPTSEKVGDVTTWTAGYFPRTATAGQDGSAEHPFEIADEDDLLALQAAVDANVGRNLCYVQTADIALTAAWPGIGVKGGKDIVSQAAYDNGAFTGVYDGGNYTISNFLMENGTDYGALFNSIYNATIKNLKLSWGSSTLCSNSSDQGGDTGASFVGVAKASTLQNLTTVAGTVTTVSASKDFGGIVGYLMAGSTVESCTNALNVASLKNTGRKCGGIAIITQSGTGTAVIRNCKNSGTVTAANKGGILGYVGVATEIDGCENTAALQLFHFQSGSITASGVNKGNATVASNDKSGGVSGLYFATVDGDVATFVADNALALNGEYKVMSAGATATYAFAEAGTIAFDTALFTPTYAITAAEGLTLTDATEGTVRTYTAAAIVTDESFSDGTTDNAFSIPATTVAELKELCGVADLAATVEGQGITYAQAYALGLIDETTGAVAELPAITIEFENGQPVVKMDGTATDGYTVTCHLYARDSLTVDWGEQPIAYGDYGDDIADPDTSLPAARFYKVKVTIANAQ